MPLPNNVGLLWVETGKNRFGSDDPALGALQLRPTLAALRPEIFPFSVRFLASWRPAAHELRSSLT